MSANLAVKTTQQRTTTITVAVCLADLAKAFGVVGARSVRIPSYGGAMSQTVEFIFECGPEEPPLVFECEEDQG